MGARHCANCDREGRDVRVCVRVWGGGPVRIVLLCPWCAGDLLSAFVADLPVEGRRAWPRDERGMKEG